MSCGHGLLSDELRIIHTFFCLYLKQSYLNNYSMNHRRIELHQVHIRCCNILYYHYKEEMVLDTSRIHHWTRFFRQNCTLSVHIDIMILTSSHDMVHNFGMSHLSKWFGYQHMLEIYILSYQVMALWNWDNSNTFLPMISFTYCMSILVWYRSNVSHLQSYKNYMACIHHSLLQSLGSQCKE